MIFNSISYIFFLALTGLLFYILPGKYRPGLLLTASIGYYLSFIPAFLPVILGLVLINYLMAFRLTRVSEKYAGITFFTVILANLLILAFFKYFNNIFPGVKVNLYFVDLFYRADPLTTLILPLGLSYLTFTLISYQIEIKRGTIKHESNLGLFSLFFLFFPKISQGPIERPQKLIPQLRQMQRPDLNLVSEGLQQIVWGYFKKLVVADRLAIYVNAVYDNSSHHNGTTLLLATIFYAFQIYADFSGYTDIALGSAKIFGIRLTNNFNRPYFATSIKDFWDRWHISLSTWLRDYLFLPLAIFLSRYFKKPKFLYVTSDKWVYLITSVVTFGVCGMWHGVGWTFLMWGLLFGFYLTFSNWTNDYQKRIRKHLHINKKSGLYKTYSTLLTFALVLFAWVFFRAGSLNEASEIVRNIVTSAGIPFHSEPKNIVFGLTGIFILLAYDIDKEYYGSRLPAFFNRHFILKALALASVLVIILCMGVFDGGQFIYFKF